MLIRGGKVVILTTIVHSSFSVGEDFFLLPLWWERETDIDSKVRKDELR